MILSKFERLDGKGFAYVLHSPDVDATRKFAQNMYLSPGDTYPGQNAVMAWEHVRSWFVPDGFGTTTMDAMRACKQSTLTFRVP